jgi:hypothetical protein
MLEQCSTWFVSRTLMVVTWLLLASSTRSVVNAAVASVPTPQATELGPTSPRNGTRRISLRPRGRPHVSPATLHKERRAHPAEQQPGQIRAGVTLHTPGVQEMQCTQIDLSESERQGLQALAQPVAAARAL